MEEQIKKLKCELCGEEHFMLIQVEVANESWMCRKGICAKCFKNGKIEEKIFLKTKNFLEKQIRTAEERVEFWKKELKKL